MPNLHDYAAQPVALRTFAASILPTLRQPKVRLLMGLRGLPTRLPKDEHPATFGLLHAVWSLCMIGGSLVGGWLVRLAPGLPFLLMGLINLGACLLVIVYYRRQAAEAAAQVTQTVYQS